MHAQWPKHAEMEHINHHLQWDPPMFAGDSFLCFFAGEQYPSLAGGDTPYFAWRKSHDPTDRCWLNPNSVEWGLVI